MYNVTWHLWNRIITCMEPLQFEDKWKTRLINKYEHLYIPLKALIQSFYTMSQLRKLHNHFAHTAAVKLYNLLKWACLEALNPKTLEKLEYIVSKCEPRQKIRTAPKRYRITMWAESTRFNPKVSIDFMYPEVPLYCTCWMTLHISKQRNSYIPWRPNRFGKLYSHYGQTLTLACWTS